MAWTLDDLTNDELKIELRRLARELAPVFKRNRGKFDENKLKRIFGTRIAARKIVETVIKAEPYEGAAILSDIKAALEILEILDERRRSKE